MSPRRRALALSITLLTLCAPARASADVQEVFQGLAERRLSPAPLVPTTAPRSLRPLDATIATLSNPRRSGYGIRLANDATDSVIALRGGEFTSMKTAVRQYRRSGFSVRSTQIRKRDGYLLTRSRDRTLLWVEKGVVYWMGSATPKTVSIKELRATAAGLDRLEGAFSGSDELGENAVFMVTTRRTVTAYVEWTANCTGPDGSPSAQRAGQAGVTLAPRQGRSFAFDIAENLRGSTPFPWQGTVSGTTDADGGTVEFRVTASTADESCDSGPKSIAVR